MRQLKGISANNSLPNSVLAVAGATIAEEEARKEADVSRRHTEKEERQELAKDALKSLNLILEMMFEAIESEAPVAKRLSQKEIELGSGKLKIKIPFPFLIKEAFSKSKKDIVCGALILLDQDAVYYRGRSANLWFGEFTSGEYRWWEIPYFYLWGGGARGEYEPFGISQPSELTDADYAASPAAHSLQHAAAPRPIDGEFAEEFIRRWAARLADASLKRLQRPTSLPES
jgi:hypothetical protein